MKKSARNFGGFYVYYRNWKTYCVLKKNIQNNSSNNNNRRANDIYYLYAEEYEAKMQSQVYGYEQGKIPKILTDIWLKYQ